MAQSEIFTKLVNELNVSKTSIRSNRILEMETSNEHGDILFNCI